jgi:LacI family transcriptional regulator
MHSVKKIILVLTGGSLHCREIARGVYQYCARDPRWEILYEGAINPGVVEHIRVAVRYWDVDGLIGQIVGEDMVGIIKDAGIPAINVSDANVSDHPTVKSDAAAIGALAARYFLEKGLKNFASCCTGNVYSRSIMQAFCGTANQAGLRCDSIRIDEFEGWTRDRQRIGDWLRSLPKPVGILMADDYDSRNLCVLCRHLGVPVPDQVAVLGVGNDDLFCSMSTPPLSSAITAARQIGHQAAALMDAILSNKTALPSTPILHKPLGIAERQSTNILQIADPQVAAALRLIHRRAGEAIGVEQILRMVPLSRSALDKRFIKVLGRTPKAEIMRVRLAQAALMLRNPNIKLSFVAVKSGFSHYSQFVELFRREMGVTPAEYRDNLLPS